jgi:hypothetical protein
MEPQDPTPEPPTDAALAALAAAVATWHNRHPLAVRIGPAQVRGMGIVALPFMAGDGAAAVAKPAFSDNFIPPIAPRQVAAFALRHGAKDRPDITPVREVAADGDAAAATMTLYLHTAAVEAGGQRLRVLMGAGGAGRARPAILGPRLWSLPRTLVAAALAGAVSSALVAVVVAVWWLSHTAAAGPVLATDTPAGPVQAAATPASGAATPALVPAPAASASAPMTVAARPPDAAASAQPEQGSAPGAGTEAGAEAATPADIRPRLSDEQRAQARLAGQRLRGESAAPAAAASASAAPTADGRSFALVTRATRGRAASEVMLSLMASAAAGAAWPGQPRTEVMQVQQGFRAVWWPFASPADAELAREALAAYGIRAEIVSF